jgi:hypothetical protein
MLYSSKFLGKRNATIQNGKNQTQLSRWIVEDKGENPVSAIETEPSGIIISSFFGYESGYSAVDTLFPGKAYWVKVSQPGILILEE